MDDLGEDEDSVLSPSNVKGKTLRDRQEEIQATQRFLVGFRV